MCQSQRVQECIKTVKGYFWIQFIAKIKLFVCLCVVEALALQKNSLVQGQCPEISDQKFDRTLPSF